MRLRLIPNWKSVAWKSHSMRALLLGVLWVVAITNVQTLTDWPIGPRMATWPLLGLLAYGAIGRLLDQGIGDDE